MVPNLLFYQLLLVALVLIYCMIHVGWPDNLSVTSKISPKPDKPRRKRSTAPQPCTGLIHKPLCEACEKGTDALPQAPGAPLLCSPAPEDAGAPSTRLSISARIMLAPSTAGSGAATSAPTDIPVASPGASCSVSPARALSLRRTGRSFMGSAPRKS
jgi:hypothetical protein